VESSIIAVRVANGSLIQVLDTSSRTRRRLVLTTIRDGQTSVKIDLYRASAEDMDNAEYISSLTIDDIEPAEKGTPDIALLLGVDDAGNLNATAIDKKSGESQSLSVSLEAGAEGGYDVPDFELSDAELSLDDLSMDEEELGEAEPFSFDEEPFAEAGALETETAETEAPPITETEEEITFDDEIPLGDELTLEEDMSVSIDEDATDTLAASAPEEELPDLEAPDELEEPSDETAGDITEDAAEDVPDISFDEEMTADLDELSMDELESGFEDELSESGVETEDAIAEFSDESVSLDASFADEEAARISAEADEVELDDGMVEAELGEEDFTFDEEPELDDNIFEAEGEETAESAEMEPEEAEFDATAFDETAFDEAGFDEAAFDETELDEAAEESDELEDTLSPEEFDRLDSQPVAAAAYSDESAEAPAPRRSNAIIFVGYLVLALAALGVLTYLVFRLLEGPPAPSLRAALPVAMALGWRPLARLVRRIWKA
jgi:molecular chaperone DnaK (HSP70)